MTFRDAAFHRECFVCTKCETQLAQLKFATKDDNPYCPECYVKLFAKICDKCNQPIAGESDSLRSCEGGEVVTSSSVVCIFVHLNIPTLSTEPDDSYCSGSMKL